MLCPVASACHIAVDDQFKLATRGNPNTTSRNVQRKSKRQLEGLVVDSTSEAVDLAGGREAEREPYLVIGGAAVDAPLARDVVRLRPIRDVV
jgi:hypothetical protein